MLMLQLLRGNFTRQVPSHAGSHSPSPSIPTALEVLVVGSGVGLHRLSHVDGQPLNAGEDWGYRRCMAAMEDPTGGPGGGAIWMSDASFPGGFWVIY